MPPNKRPEPRNKKLYEQVKKEAKKKFKSWPSAYASGWLVQEYKRRGGTYYGRKPTDTGLQRWFDEEWVNICEPKYKPCGRPVGGMKNYAKEYPYCRPLIRITSKTPKTVGELSSSEIKKRCSIKRSKQNSRVLSEKR